MCGVLSEVRSTDSLDFGETTCTDFHKRQLGPTGSSGSRSASARSGRSRDVGWDVRAAGGRRKSFEAIAGSQGDATHGGGDRAEVIPSHVLLRLCQTHSST